MKIEEFLPIFSQVKKEKEQGCYEDFLECLKLYDKNENGLMLSAELAHTIMSLGERLSDSECDEVLKDCMDPEDDDGQIPYARKYLFHPEYYSQFYETPPPPPHPVLQY